MKNMTRLPGSGKLPEIFLAVIVIAYMVSACAPGAADPGPEKDPDARARLQVVTTIFPQYDFARQIAGEEADVYMLLKPGEEVHSYEPTPRDIRRIQGADLFIYTGGENDVWVESILASVGEDGPEAVRLLDLVDTYAEERLEGMMPEKGEREEASHEGASEDEEGGDEDDAHGHGEEPDEHVWTSPENCVTLIGALTEKFCAADPAHADSYRANGGACQAAFEELDREFREMADSAPRKTILFGDRFPFRYLAEELGLTCYAAFSGCSSESEPSAATIAFLVDKAAQERLPVVFKIEFSNGNIAQAVCEAARLRTGSAMQVLQLHSCHNVTRDEFESGETCLTLMRRNLEALRTALGAD